MGRGSLMCLTSKPNQPHRPIAQQKDLLLELKSAVMFPLFSILFGNIGSLVVWQFLFASGILACRDGANVLGVCTKQFMRC